jgi:hypothetical protein
MTANIGAYAVRVSKGKKPSFLDSKTCDFVVTFFNRKSLKCRFCGLKGDVNFAFQNSLIDICALLGAFFI